MAETTIKFKRGPSSKLGQLAIEDGSLILTKDSKNLYIDVDNTRVSITPQKATDDDIRSLFPETPKTMSLKNNPHATTTHIDGADEIEVEEF